LPNALNVNVNVTHHSEGSTPPEDSSTGEKRCPLRPSAVPLTDGADDAGVPGRDRLLVDVQQTEVLQEGVGHAGVQLLPLDEGVWQGHGLRIAPETSCRGKGNPGEESVHVSELDPNEGSNQSGLSRSSFQTKLTKNKTLSITEMSTKCANNCELKLVHPHAPALVLHKQKTEKPSDGLCRG